MIETDLPPKPEPRNARERLMLRQAFAYGIIWERRRQGSFTDGGSPPPVAVSAEREFPEPQPRTLPVGRVTFRVVDGVIQYRHHGRGPWRASRWSPSAIAALNDLLERPNVGGKRHTRDVELILEDEYGDDGS